MVAVRTDMSGSVLELISSLFSDSPRQAIIVIMLFLNVLLTGVIVILWREIRGIRRDLNEVHEQRIKDNEEHRKELTERMDSWSRTMDKVQDAIRDMSSLVSKIDGKMQ